MNYWFEALIEMRLLEYGMLQKATTAKHYQQLQIGDTVTI